MHYDQCHEWQQKRLRELVDELRLRDGRHAKVANIACKEDPARIGELFGATNVDIMTYDPQTNRDLTILPNFVHASALDLPIGWDERFDITLLGEFIEHCVEPAAIKALREAARVTKHDGYVVLSFPLDNRPPEAQHAKQDLRVYTPGDTGQDITVWHQTVWTDDRLSRLFVEAGLVERTRTPLVYPFLHSQSPTGWGIVLERGRTP